MTIKILNDDNFDEFISEGKAVVDFYADWCGPCKIMAPHFESASRKIKGVKFAKVDVDSNSELAGRFQIRSIPTTIFFKNGELVSKQSGAMSEKDIAEIVESDF